MTSGVPVNVPRQAEEQLCPIQAHHGPDPAGLLPVHEITLSHPADFAGWRAAARRLLAAGVRPEVVRWRVDDKQPSLFEPALAAAPAPASACSVPRHFVRLAEEAALHADPDRFALLYRLLWRLVHGERAVLLSRRDRDVARVEAMAAAVRRCAHKLKAFIRFREVPTTTGPHLVAWYEPEHHVLEHVAPFFARRFPGQRWTVVTPSRSVHSDGASLLLGPGGHRRDVPQAHADDEAWSAYAAQLVKPPRRLAALPAGMEGEDRPAANLVRLRGADHPQGLAEARSMVEACRACRLGGRDAPASFGEGPHRAAIMLVGEQPGEPESPAARLLAQALTDAGLNHDNLYRTQAVKHPKRRRRDGRRLPVAPEPDEIAACRRWLDLERALVRPQLIVALGAIAAGALLERPVALGLERGRIMPLEDGSRLLVTAEPGSIVAIPDPTAQGREYRRLVSDLLLAVPHLRRAA